MFYNNYEKSMRQNNYIVPEDESVIKTILKVSEAYSVDDVSLEELKTVLESLEFYLPACNLPEKAYGYHDEKCNKIWGCLDELNSYQNPDSTIREKCFETFKECFDKYVFSREVERRIKEHQEKLLRTSHFYGKKPLSEIEIGEKYKFYIFNISLFKNFEEVHPDLVEKYKKLFRGVKPEHFIKGSDWKRDKEVYGVIIDKHPAIKENDLDMITVAFKVETKNRGRFYVEAKCETGFDISDYGNTPTVVESDIQYKRVEEERRPLLRQLIKMNKEQFVEYYKLIKSYGECFMSKKNTENFRKEITQLLRIDPRINPKYVKTTDELFFFNYMNYIVVAQVLSKYINRQTKIATKIAETLVSGTLEEAKAVPVPFNLFPNIE